MRVKLIFQLISIRMEKSLMKWAPNEEWEETKLKKISWWYDKYDIIKKKKNHKKIIKKLFNSAFVLTNFVIS